MNRARSRMSGLISIGAHGNSALFRSHNGNPSEPTTRQSERVALCAVASAIHSRCRRSEVRKRSTLNDHPDSDSLYVELSERPSVDSREISAGIVLDYDATGTVVGVDIGNASRKVRLNTLVLSNLATTVAHVAS